MKKLIFSLLLISIQAYAVNEVVEPDTGKHIVSQIKEVQITDMISKTDQFQPCREKYKYDAKADQATRTAALKDAEKCFKDELTKKSSPEQLKKLSSDLNLQHYGLVQSDNVKEIQTYLTNKMLEALTGVNPKDLSGQAYKESLKFGKKKIVDQKLFIDMYKTQLGKNALYEVSRFCFENFRYEAHPAGTAPTNFGEYWAGYSGNGFTQKVTDTGNPKFGNFQNSGTDKEKVFQDIFSSIQTSGDTSKTMSEENMSKFFMDCGQQIVPLCDAFKTSKTNLADTKSGVDSALSTGATACLAKSRIMDYRRALADAEKVAEQFQNMEKEDRQSFLVALDSGKPQAQVFGNSDSDATIDDLTNNTSADIFNDGYTKDQLAEKKAKECEEKPELSSCEGYITDDDSLDKAKHSIELEMTLKREVEMARVRELKEKNDADLETYLKDNGYFELLNGDEYKKISSDDLVKAIGESYEAKKLATLEQINNKLGKRQVKKDETISQADAKSVIQDSKEERARLAQVVLFNNIITSNLALKKSDGSDAGRNVNAWKKEADALTQASVDESLFANLKASSDGAVGMGRDSQIAGFEILDQLLGKETPKPAP